MSDFEDYDQTESEEDEEDEEVEEKEDKRTYPPLVNKKNHENYPFYVTHKNEIYLEAFNKNAKMALALLTVIAAPMKRAEHLQIHALTTSSLYGAVSSGISVEVIIQKLSQLSKNYIPEKVVDFIKVSTSKYGKASLVLKDGKMKIETMDKHHLDWLVKQEGIKQNVIHDTQVQSENKDITVPVKEDYFEQSRLAEDTEQFQKILEKNSDKNITTNIYSVEINALTIEKVQAACGKLGANLLVEYDFQSDNQNKDINGDLRTNISLRPYQSKALSAMLKNSRARSGLIVLPCGAGKTLVGVAAAMIIRKKFIIFCSGEVAVDQWYDTIIKYTTVDKKQIALFTGKTKDAVKNQDVLITTYQSLDENKRRSKISYQIIDWIKRQDWGLVVLDEVHSAAAKGFRKVLTTVKSHCQLGLTATLVREDDLVDDLHFLIGPKLYEANWMELQDQGFIARIQCVEVKCPLSTEFCQAFLKETVDAKKTLMYIMNPEKIRRSQFLINYHEGRGEKILVFLDNLFAIKEYSRLLGKSYIDGKSTHEQRQNALKAFKESKTGHTLIVSKIADVAFDLPEASILIQASFQGGSRRQEAQRLGRITRSKKDMKINEINGYFYSLITPHTKEENFKVKRQRFLKDQGYVYKVVTKFEGMDNADLVLSTSNERKDLLEKVKNATKEEAEIEGKRKQKTKREINADKMDRQNSIMSKKRKEMEERNTEEKRKRLT